MADMPDPRLLVNILTDDLYTIPLRVFAHGGGVQSTAALVLSAQGKIDFPFHLFSNVGDDSENPKTLRYVREVSMPYARAHGIELIELHRTLRDGTPETLLGRVMKENTVSIPVRLGYNLPAQRSCTSAFKLGVIAKWLREHGATKHNPAVVGVGISMDELQRATDKNSQPYERREFPLLDLRLTRNECHRIITEAGLPTPPKSSCWFCPFHTKRYLSELRRDDPETFERVAQIEDSINERRRLRGKDDVHMTDGQVPLRDAVQPAQATMFSLLNDMDSETCDEGVCFV